MSYGGGLYGGGGFGFAIGMPDLALEQAKSLSPHGVALAFSVSLADNAARLAAGSYSLAAVTPGATVPNITAVHDVMDPFQVALEFDERLTHTAVYRVTVTGALESTDGDPIDPANDEIDWTHVWLTNDRPALPEIEPIMQALTDGLGRRLGQVAGFHFTRLAEPYQFGDTEMVVDGTLHFPDSGTVYVGTTKAHPKGLRFAYAGREPHRLTGVVAGDATDRLIGDPVDQSVPDTGEISAGELVLDWSRDYSFTDRARQCAFYQMAVGGMLDAVAARHGFGRPMGMSDSTFAGLLETIVYKERCLWWVLYQALRAALCDYWIDLSGVIASAHDVQQGAVFDVRNWMAGHYVEDASGIIYRARSGDDASGLLRMDEYQTPWTRAWTYRHSLEVVDLIMMPFRISEIWPAADDPDWRMIVRIYLRLPPDAWAPGTYLQDEDPPGSGDSVLTPANGAQPPRGFVLADAEAVGPGAGDDYQAFYISGMDATAAPGSWLLRLIREIVPAGCRVETVALPAE